MYNKADLIGATSKTGDNNLSFDIVLNCNISRTIWTARWKSTSECSDYCPILFDAKHIAIPAITPRISHRYRKGEKWRDLATTHRAKSTKNGPNAERSSTEFLMDYCVIGGLDHKPYLSCRISKNCYNNLNFNIPTYCYIDWSTWVAWSKIGAECSHNCAILSDADDIALPAISVWISHSYC